MSVSILLTLLMGGYSDPVVSGVAIESYQAKKQGERAVNRRHAELDLDEPVIIPSILDSYRPAERWVSEGNLSWDEYSDRVRFRMRNGRLMPQVKELASHLKGAAVTPGDDSWFQWSSSPNFQWANSVELEEQSVEHLIDRLMLSYGLNLNITANGVVLIYD